MRRQQPWDHAHIPDAGSTNEEIAQVYQCYAPPIFAYLRMHAPSREDAEDLLVETFLAALENEYFKGLSEEAQRSWLWRVARNKAADMFRTGSRRRRLLPLEDVAEALYSDDELAPEQSALYQEEYTQLQNTVRRLPPLQQEIVRLRFVNGLHCTEIATVLGKREGTVRSLLSRTLNLLRAIYKNA